MYKSLAFVFLFLICFSCKDNSNQCEYIHVIGLSVEPMSESILVNYSFSNLAFAPIDPTPSPELSCEPETIEILISRNGVDFESVVTLDEISGSYLIENLEDCEYVTVKLEGQHPDLNTVSATRQAVVGEIALPEFTNNPLSMEEFNVSPNADQMIYRNFSNDWFLSSLSSPAAGNNIFIDVFNASWNPIQTNKVAGVENILVPILPNVNGWASKYLVEYDLNTGEKVVLHEIENNMDFDNDVFKPELYWIHFFSYSLDGQSIYFKSNKDNGGASITEQKVFDNIWKLDLATKEIEIITDFLPLNYDLIDFVEDPKQPGNFYISGGERDVEIETDENSYTIDLVDIHYFNASDNSITPIFVSSEETKYLSIDPSGENLLFTTEASGITELRSINISSQKQKQITFSNEYKALKDWYHLNWISNTEFTTVVRRNGELNFAKFNIE